MHINRSFSTVPKKIVNNFTGDHFHFLSNEFADRRAIAMPILRALAAIITKDSVNEAYSILRI
jgi:hypothetical protein